MFFPSFHKVMVNFNNTCESLGGLATTAEILTRVTITLRK